MYRIWFPDCSKLAVNWKNSNGLTICWYDLIVNFFWRCFVSLLKFRFWSKFHVIIITGSGVMAISFYKGFTRNWKIWNTPVWLLPNIWRLRRIKNTKCSTKIPNKMLLNAAKFQVYSFHHFSVIKGKPTEGGRSIHI